MSLCVVVPYVKCSNNYETLDADLYCSNLCVCFFFNFESWRLYFVFSLLNVTVVFTNIAIDLRLLCS